MDKIYIELIQKDSLNAQAKISQFKEIKYKQILDSTQKDVNSLKSSVNSLKQKNEDLFNRHTIQKDKIKRNRKIAFVAICVAILELLVIIP